MKKLILLISILLMALPVSAQHFGRDTRHSYEQRHDRGRKHHEKRSHRKTRKSRKHFTPRDEVRCMNDWQELWNGCHVRIKMDKIYIYDNYDEKILSGDEVTLLPNGCYKVYNGAFWYAHSPKGERIGNIWGDRVELMKNGVFRCRRAGMDHYYDADGRERK